jgi:hypothetical protein
MAPLWSGWPSSFCQTSFEHTTEWRDHSFGSASPKVDQRKHIVDIAFLIPSGLRKCWIWKSFVAFDRIVNIQGIGVVVYCAGQDILAGVAYLFTQVSEGRFYVGAWSKRESASPAKSYSSVI